MTFSKLVEFAYRCMFTILLVKETHTLWPSRVIFKQMVDVSRTAEVSIPKAKRFSNRLRHVIFHRCQLLLVFGDSRWWKSSYHLRPITCSQNMWLHYIPRRTVYFLYISSPKYFIIKLNSFFLATNNSQVCPQCANRLNFIFSTLQKHNSVIGSSQ